MVQDKDCSVGRRKKRRAKRTRDGEKRRWRRRQQEKSKKRFIHSIRVDMGYRVKSMDDERWMMEDGDEMGLKAAVWMMGH